MRSSPAAPNERVAARSRAGLQNVHPSARRGDTISRGGPQVLGFVPPAYNLGAARGSARMKFYTGDQFPAESRTRS